MQYCDVGIAECWHNLLYIASDLSHQLKKFINNVAGEAKLFLIHILKVLVLNLDPDKGFPNVFCSASLQMLEYIRVCHDHILYSFTNRHLSLCHMIYHTHPSSRVQTRPKPSDF